MPPPYVSALRVYEPLAAFPADEQAAWRAYRQARTNGGAHAAAGGGAVTTGGDELTEERTVTWSAVGTGLAPRLDELAERASLLEHGGLILVCPWATKTRAARAALTAREGVPPVLADAMVPLPLTSAAERALGERDEPDSAEPRLHVLTATWGPPVRWFVLFDESEREVRELDAGSTNGTASVARRRRVVFRTEMSNARRRAARALAVLRRGLGEVSVVEATERTARWLEEFHPRSVVELDYGPVADLFDDDALAEDTSAADVAAALAALGNGDGAAAGEAYERVSERWRAIQAHERAN